ncbi:MAG: hypothetical protein LBF97_05920 [Elusimicrobiota bacterium]|jgi:hypothetical protein|nr:hypothetical protein [Elusimicrobiota bacterium]
MTAIHVGKKDNNVSIWFYCDKTNVIFKKDFKEDDPITVIDLLEFFEALPEVAIIHAKKE